MPRLLAFAALFALVSVGCGGGAKPKSKSKAPAEDLTAVVKDGGGAKKSPGKGTPKDDTPADPGDDTPTTISIPLAIRNLKSDVPAERLEAVNVLAAAEYDAAIGEEVAAGLIRRLADVEKGTRTAAVGALRKWARPSDVGAIAGLFARTDPDIRHRAIEVLSGLKTDASAREVAARLTSAFDREQARLALLALGGVSELPLLEEYVEDPDADVRLAVVTVLEVVGTRESIEPLIELQGDPDPRVATAAAKALMEVETR